MELLGTILKLNALDWLLLALIAFSVFSAFRGGLVKAVLSLSGLISGVLVATWFQDRIAYTVPAYRDFGTKLQTVVFTVIVIAVYAAFLTVSGWVRESTAGAGKGLGDRLLSACFGAARGALLGAVVLTVVSVGTLSPSTIKESVLSPYLLAGTNAVSLVVAGNIPGQIDVQNSHRAASLADSLAARINQQ